MDRRYQGRSDQPLAPEGTADALALAERLRGRPIARILASPLQRAAATARILAAGLGLAPPAFDPRLAEIAYGAWEGLTQAEIRQRWPEELRRWKRAPETMRFPGGESLDEVRARLLAFLSDEALRMERRMGAVLAVTHAGLIRIAALEASGRSLAGFRRIEVAPAGAWQFRCHVESGTECGAVRIEESESCVS
ncbi:MAG: histidine phosphatase family protein [Rhodospirillales bacterium]|nr:histidine phosphatase family protein [Rhodospirillales bacterium]